MTEELESVAASEKRRRARIEEMKRMKAKQQRQRRILKAAIPFALVAILLLLIGIKVISRPSNDKEAEQKHQAQKTSQTQEAKQEEVDNSVAILPREETMISDNGQKSEGFGTFIDKVGGTSHQTAEIVATAADAVSFLHDLPVIYSAEENADTMSINGEVTSTYGIFIDLDSAAILAERNGKYRINPASMTKILTVLVAAEQLEAEDLDDTFTMTLDITDYSYIHDCSNVGFLDGETVTVRDLLYGTVLPSGGDAAVGLATYVAGSQEAFVELMNEKIEELGLSGTTHFTNCVGIYDENHYSTCYDMAMIMEAAVANELCREVMHARTYTTSFTEQHPEGITVSNWFLRRIEDKETGGEVYCAKTGYVVQSGNCAASYGIDDDGKEYICVTADAHSSWRCIYDHVALYSQFMS